jgi:hypothetical protein
VIWIIAPLEIGNFFASDKSCGENVVTYKGYCVEICEASAALKFIAVRGIPLRFQIHAPERAIARGVDQFYFCLLRKSCGCKSERAENKSGAEIVAPSKQ